MLLGNLLKKSAVPSAVSCDVLVIGGGSGGLACAQAAARKGASVVLCDFVRPSETRQTTWGFGGTCVNVGCIPKKLLHRAGFFGQALTDGEMEAFGFSTRGVGRPDWATAVATVQNHIKMLNFTYSSALPANCTYLNGQAAFGDDGETVVVRSGGKGELITTVSAAKAIVIAVGGRPIIPPHIKNGSKLGVSSDDLFSLKKEPKKTLVVGSSYIGLETASFLNALGVDTTVAIRSKPLRGKGFDEDCAEKLVELMASNGVKVLRNVDVKALEETEDFRIEAQFSNATSEVVDTVLFGTGRRPETKSLGLPDRLRLAENEKIVVDPQTFIASPPKGNGPTIYAIGDCAETSSPELTPVAIRQGELVASSIVNEDINNTKRFNALNFVPSTVFTLPSEYSRIGLSEKEAIEQYGLNDIETYLREWQPLEAGAAHIRAANGGDAALRSFAKMVCVKSQNERIVGLHLVSPASSEAIHGLSLACSLGATKSDFDAKVLGIHPTDTEALTDMTITRSSGLPFQVASGCGGGKCG